MKSSDMYKKYQDYRLYHFLSDLAGVHFNLEVDLCKGKRVQDLPKKWFKS